jgi:hypothetical protein
MPPVAGLVKAYREALRRVHARGAGLEEHVQQHASALTHASVDPHRALGKFRRLLVDGDLRSAWSASKQRARERLALAYAAYASSVGLARAGSRGEAASAGASDAAEIPDEFRGMLESHPALRVRRLDGARPDVLRRPPAAIRGAAPRDPASPDPHDTDAHRSAPAGAAC